MTLPDDSVTYQLGSSEGYDQIDHPLVDARIENDFELPANPPCDLNFEDFLRDLENGHFDGTASSSSQAGSSHARSLHGYTRFPVRDVPDVFPTGNQLQCLEIDTTVDPMGGLATATSQIPERHGGTLNQDRIRIMREREMNEIMSQMRSLRSRKSELPYIVTSALDPSRRDRICGAAEYAQLNCKSLSGRSHGLQHMLIARCAIETYGTDAGPPKLVLDSLEYNDPEFHHFIDPLVVRIDIGLDTDQSVVVQWLSDNKIEWTPIQDSDLPANEATRMRFNHEWVAPYIFDRIRGDHPTVGVEYAVFTRPDDNGDANASWKPEADGEPGEDPGKGAGNTMANAMTRLRGKRGKYPCGFCGKPFDIPSLLRKHLPIHSVEKPHVCYACVDKNGDRLCYRRQTDLGKHMRKHHSVKWELKKIRKKAEAKRNAEAKKKENG